MFRKFLTGVAAVVVAATVAGAANLSLQSGPQDPSQLLATINTLIQSINTGVNGRLSANTVATGADPTSETTLYSYAMPASQLATTGDAVRVVCWGKTASNANAKNARLYFGSSQLSSATVTDAPNNKNWRLEMVVMRSGAATQDIIGRGEVSGLTTTVYTTPGTETMSSAITIKCTSLTPTAAQDLTAQGMLVEQIK